MHNTDFNIKTTFANPVQFMGSVNTSGWRGIATEAKGTRLLDGGRAVLEKVDGVNKFARNKVSYVTGNFLMR